MFKSILTSGAKSALQKNKSQSYISLLNQSRFASRPIESSKPETIVLEKESEGNASSLSVPFFAPATDSSTQSFNMKDEENFSQVQKTILENGFTVLSTDSPSKATSVLSLAVDAGSRYENFLNSGVSHFVQRFFYSATNQRSYLQLVSELQRTGADVSAQSGREEIVYRTESLREGVPKVLELVSNSVLQSRLHEWDLKSKKEVVLDDLTHFLQSPQLTLTEALHITAFNGRALGRPLLANPQGIDNMTTEKVIEYMNKFYVPSRMSLVATNMNHDDLVEMAYHTYGSLPTSNSYTLNTTETSPAIPHIEKEPTVYTGGDYQMAETRTDSDGVQTHSVIGFQSAPASSVDSYVYEVIAQILGSGRKFYKPTLKQSSQLQNTVDSTNGIREATSFNLSYSDSGLFGVYVTSSDSTTIGDAIIKSIDAIKSIAGGELSQKVQGAKNRLLMNLLSNLESNAGLNEFLTKQHINNLPFNQRAHIDLIKNITEEDVKRCAEAMLKSKPTLVSYGNLHKVPTTHDLKF